MPYLSTTETDGNNETDGADENNVPDVSHFSHQAYQAHQSNQAYQALVPSNVRPVCPYKTEISGPPVAGSAYTHRITFSVKTFTPAQADRLTRLAVAD